MNKWISLKDKTPPVKKTVIFRVKYDGTIWHAKTGWVKQWDEELLIVIPDDNSLKNRMVTHYCDCIPNGDLNEM